MFWGFGFRVLGQWRSFQLILLVCYQDMKRFVPWAVGQTQAIIFVDREKPCINGWNPRHASSALPKKWERATDFLDDPKLTIDGQNANDVDQGDVGDCYLLGGTAAIVRRRRSFVRTVFPAYDIQVGVYGVLFSMEGHYTYEIVDDYLPVNNSSKRVWAKSTSPQELWVSMLEKAYY